MRELLLQKQNLTKMLRQLLVLTLFSLPLTTLGATETVTRTISFNEVVSVTSPNIHNCAFPVTITDVVGGSQTSPSGTVKFLDSGDVIKECSCNSYGAVFTLNSTASTNTTNTHYFEIEIPGTYPKVPQQVALTIAFSNAANQPGIAHKARIQVGDYDSDAYISDASNLAETTINYIGNSSSTDLGTKRDDEKPLYIRVYVNGSEAVATTFTIKKAIITYEREIFDLTVAGVQVKSDNANNILSGANDNKISFEPANSNNSNVNTLTLDGASFNGSVVSGLENLTVLLKNDNTITRSDTASVFNSTNNTAPLTFKHENDATLTISNSSSNRWPVIWNFHSIDYTTNGLSLISPMPVKYAEASINSFVAKGLIPAYKAPQSLNTVTFTTATVYPLWVAGTQVTEANKGNIIGGAAGPTTSSATFTPSDGTNEAKLSLSNVSINNNSIISGVGNLTIIIEEENTIIASSDTIPLIRSTNGGKLTITKTGTTASLLLQNSYSTSPCHLPVIKDFASFELADGLYISNTRSDYNGSNHPVAYEHYTNSNFSGMGLIDPTYGPNDQTRGISQVKFSTDDNYYPIWVANTQITSYNKGDVLSATNPGKVIFTPASTDNGNVNTLRISGISVTEETVSGLKNLTIEFSGVNNLGTSSGSNGEIHGTNPNAEITFKALSEDGEINIHTNNGYNSVVEGFKDVKFIDAATQGNQTYDTTQKMYMDGAVPENSLTIIAKGNSYGLKIGNKEVTNLNYTNVFGDGKVSFEPASDANNNVNTLTLNGATIDGTIVNSLSNLTIAFQGTNSLTGSSGYISSTENTAALTLKGGTGTSTLSLTNTTGYSAVEGFASVTLDGAYLKADNICKYYVENRAYKFSDGIKVQSLQFTTTLYYPLWVGSKQVYNGNKDDIFNDVANSNPITASFTPSSNTLTLNGISIDSSNGIESGLNSLIIDLKGDNSINTNTAGHYNPIYSSDETATLTIQKATDATSCELSLSSASKIPQMIKGFASVSHDGLNFASKTGGYGSKIDDASTKDAILTTATIYPLWVGGALVTSNNTSGTGWLYTAEDNKLTLSGYTKSDNEDHAFISNMANLNIFLTGTNTVEPSSSVSGTKAFYTTYPDATLTFSTNENDKGTLDASGFNTLCEGFRDVNGIYCNNGLGYFPSERKIEAKKSPTISFAKADQTTGDRIYPYEYITACETTYGTSFKAPKPTFNNGYIDLCDSTKYVYSYDVDKIVKFAEDGNDYGNPGKIPYGELSILKAGEVTITCSFPGNMQNNPCSASYTLKINKANATFEYKVGTTTVTTSDGYIDVNGNGQWGTPTGTTAGTEPSLSKPNDITATITYSSSDNNVATVDNTGKVTPKGMGSTTITASLNGDDNYNNATASYALNVKVPATIKFTNATASVLNTESYTQEAIVTPTGATVVYSPSNTNVSVDADGKVTPNNSYIGKVTITATVTSVPDATPQYYYILADDDHFKASYELTVSKVFNNVTFANGVNYATYCNTEEDDLTKPEGITVYAVKIPTSGNEVTLSEINFIPGTQDSSKPEYTAVLLKRDKSSRTDFGTVTKYVRQSGDIIPSNENNDLVYTPSDKLTDGKQYILYKDEFVKAQGTISASKCYLENTTGNHARGFVIGDGNDDSTAIDATLLDDGETNNEEWYDLQGRRIAKPTKAGLYIKNGKKMVINNK